MGGGSVGGRGCAGQRGVKRGKWDNCNSIINKIYLKRKTRISIDNLLKMPIISTSKSLTSKPHRTDLHIPPHAHFEVAKRVKKGKAC